MGPKSINKKSTKLCHWFVEICRLIVRYKSCKAIPVYISMHVLGICMEKNSAMKKIYKSNNEISNNNNNKHNRIYNWANKLCKEIEKQNTHQKRCWCYAIWEQVKCISMPKTFSISFWPLILYFQFRAWDNLKKYSLYVCCLFLFSFVRTHKVFTLNLVRMWIWKELLNIFCWYVVCLNRSLSDGLMVCVHSGSSPML